MNFLGLGPGELLVVMVLALIVFGPQKLPEIGRGLGKAIGEFRRATSEITQEFNRELQLDSILNPTTEQAPPARKNQVVEAEDESNRASAAKSQVELVAASAPEESPPVEAEGGGEKKQEIGSGEL